LLNLLAVVGESPQDARNQLVVAVEKVVLIDDGFIEGLVIVCFNILETA